MLARILLSDPRPAGKTGVELDRNDPLVMSQRPDQTISEFESAIADLLEALNSYHYRFYGSQLPAVAGTDSPQLVFVDDSDLLAAPPPAAETVPVTSEPTSAEPDPNPNRLIRRVFFISAGAIVLLIVLAVLAAGQASS